MTPKIIIEYPKNGRNQTVITHETANMDIYEITLSNGPRSVFLDYRGQLCQTCYVNQWNPI